MEYSFVKGLIKKLKEAGVYFLGFGVYVFFANPELLNVLLENWLGAAGAVTAMTIVGLIINYIKVTNQELLPRIAE